MRVTEFELHGSLRVIVAVVQSSPFVAKTEASVTVPQISTLMTLGVRDPLVYSADVAVNVNYFVLSL